MCQHTHTNKHTNSSFCVLLRLQYCLPSGPTPWPPGVCEVRATWHCAPLPSPPSPPCGQPVFTSVWPWSLELGTMCLCISTSPGYWSSRTCWVNTVLYLMNYSLTRLWRSWCVTNMSNTNAISRKEGTYSALWPFLISHDYSFTLLSLNSFQGVEETWTGRYPNPL